MERPPRIAEAEWAVMNAIWDHFPVTASEVVEHLPKTAFSRDLGTIKTYLGRLVKKGLLSTEKSGRSFLYRPLFSRETCLSVELDALLEKSPTRDARFILNHFLETDALPASDLERVLDEARRREKG